MRRLARVVRLRPGLDGSRCHTRRVAVGQLVATGVGTAFGAAGSPYLASLTMAAVERGRGWWRHRQVGPGRLLVVAGVAAVLGGLAGAGAGWSPVLPASLLLAAAGAVLVVVDAQRHRLPDPILGFAAAGTIGLLAVAGACDGMAPVLRSLTAGLLVLALFLALALAAPASVGLGDVKLAGLLAGYLGWFG